MSSASSAQAVCTGGVWGRIEASVGSPRIARILILDRLLRKPTSISLSAKHCQESRYLERIAQRHGMHRPHNTAGYSGHGNKSEYWTDLEDMRYRLWIQNSRIVGGLTRRMYDPEKPGGSPHRGIYTAGSSPVFSPLRFQARYQGS